MIRKLQKTDVDRVADIWLDTNKMAHDFISASYWQGYFEAVKEMFLQAEMYVYEMEEEHRIQGFIGLDQDYIAGIFVCKEAQGCGIGRQLLGFVKERRKQLSLHVYVKNVRAVTFYQREGFIIQTEGMDENTGEKEYSMIWKGMIKHEQDFNHR